MMNIRRIYLYGVSLVSLMVVLWGSIGLLRSLLGGEEIGSGTVNRLAGALSLILVGIPVFGIHWWLAQRNAHGGTSEEMDERFAIERGVFLYAVLLFTLVPVLQNLLAFLSRLILQIQDMDPQQAFLGGAQTWSDNLVAILANLIAAAYFAWNLRQDWRDGPPGSEWKDIRRFYRYFWLFYGLVMVVFGLQQTIEFIFVVPEALGNSAGILLANGLALLMIGVPLWISTDLLVQRSLVDPAESESLMRLIFLYLIVLISAIAFLASAGVVIYEILRQILGLASRFTSFLSQVSVPFSIALPMGMIWVYYGRRLRSEFWQDKKKSFEMDLPADVTNQKESQRRENLRRVYLYSLGLVGLAAVFIGLQQLLAVLIELSFTEVHLGVSAQRDRLAAGLAALVVGLPVWIVVWRWLEQEANRQDESGDFARRSLLRKGYLYLILFVGVVGAMFSTVALLYQLFLAILGKPSENFIVIIMQQFSLLALFGVLLSYHGWVLRKDSRLEEKTLARRYAQYPVLIIAPDDEFGLVIASTLQKRLPGLPVAIHPLSGGAPDISLGSARAVILPAEAAIHPAEALRLWLQGYDGERIVVALPAQGWYWIPGNRRSLEMLARQAARTVRQLAEEQSVTPPRDLGAWSILIAILAGLFILELIMALIILVGSIWFG